LPTHASLDLPDGYFSPQRKYWLITNDCINTIFTILKPFVTTISTCLHTTVL